MLKLKIMLLALCSLLFTAEAYAQWAPQSVYPKVAPVVSAGDENVQNFLGSLKLLSQRESNIQIETIDAVSSQQAVGVDAIIPSRMYLAAITSDIYNPQAWQDPFTQLNWYVMESNNTVDATNPLYPMRNSWIGFAFLVNDYFFPTITATYKGQPLTRYVAPPTLTQNPAVFGVDGSGRVNQWVELWYCINCTGAGSLNVTADFGLSGSPRYTTQQVWVY